MRVTGSSPTRKTPSRAPAVFELFEEVLLADARDGVLRVGVVELRAVRADGAHLILDVFGDVHDKRRHDEARVGRVGERGHGDSALARLDRKSTRLNSSHANI